MPRNIKQIDADLTNLQKDFTDSQKWIQSFRKKVERGGAKAEAVGGAATATGGSVEVTGASLGLKLFNAEHTFFDLREMIDRRKGLLPEQIKPVADRAAAAVDRIYPVTVRLNTEFPEVKRTVQAAHERLNRIQPKVSSLESSLRAMRNRVGNSVPGSRTANYSNMGSFSEAAAQINRLENRIDRLVSALG
ncbi:hypothetical protein [Streptomyces sp. NPDC058755]|uniref:hypothetical protein n=1 Tax=Streptomyces sp. NPDC058755 TaxID=3346624 RepID=UPI0036B45119